MISASWMYIVYNINQINPLPKAKVCLYSYGVKLYT